MQVAAVDHHIRGAEAAGGFGEIEMRELATVQGVTHHQAARGDAEIDDLVEQVPRAQDAGGVRRHLQPGAHLEKCLRAARRELPAARA